MIPLIPIILGALTGAVVNKAATKNKYANGGDVSVSEIKKFLPKNQWWILNNKEFEDIIPQLKSVISKLPKTYETDSIKSANKELMLHYFYGDMDWYIVERDIEENQIQAYGYVKMGYDGEWGYINIEELVNNGKVELDLHFEPIKFSHLEEEE